MKLTKFEHNHTGKHHIVYNENKFCDITSINCPACVAEIRTKEIVAYLAQYWGHDSEPNSVELSLREFLLEQGIIL